MKINIGICGATGSVGKVLIKKISESCDISLSGEFSSKDPLEKLDALCQNSDVIIDFSNRNILRELLDNAVKNHTKLVIGTTGYNDVDFQNISRAAKIIPIIYSANMSLGANLLMVLAENAAKILDSQYDIAIHELHHRSKKDSPSGTAIRLAKLLAAVRSTSQDSIAISPMRGGKVAGMHQIAFLGNNEIINIEHQSLNRETYSEGAIDAAKWLMPKQPGLYSMEDVFAIKSKILG